MSVGVVEKQDVHASVLMEEVSGHLNRKQFSLCNACVQRLTQISSFGGKAPAEVSYQP